MTERPPPSSDEARSDRREAVEAYLRSVEEQDVREAYDRVLGPVPEEPPALVEDDRAGGLTETQVEDDGENGLTVAQVEERLLRLALAGTVMAAPPVALLVLIASGDGYVALAIGALAGVIGLALGFALARFIWRADMERLNITGLGLPSYSGGGGGGEGGGGGDGDGGGGGGGGDGGGAE